MERLEADGRQKYKVPLEAGDFVYIKAKAVRDGRIQDWWELEWAKRLEEAINLNGMRSRPRVTVPLLVSSFHISALCSALLCPSHPSICMSQQGRGRG